MNSSVFSPGVKTTSLLSKEHHGPSISALAHEVRNPLTNINLALGLLQSAIKDNNLKMYLGVIMRSSIRINDLVSDLLKTGQTDEVPEEKHSIHQLLDEVLEMAKDRIGLKNITVKKDYAAQDFNIEFNRPEMRIALTNIIVNAIEAMSLVRGELTLTTRSIRNKYVIHIADNGCGISKENLGSIFKPFFSKKPGGLGIGLSATYDILQSNHVKVNVESTEGKGTHFILLFDKNQPYAVSSN